jgi:hypothetical protein
VAAADGIRFVVDMPGRIVRVNDQLVGFGRAEMKDARLVMIDPDDGVIVLAHADSLSRRYGNRDRPVGMLNGDTYGSGQLKTVALNLA